MASCTKAETEQLRSTAWTMLSHEERGLCFAGAHARDTPPLGRHPARGLRGSTEDKDALHFHGRRVVGRVLVQGMVVPKLNGQNSSSLKDFRRTHFDSTGSTWELETDRGVAYCVEFEKMLSEQLVAASSPMGRHLLRPACTRHVED